MARNDWQLAAGDDLAAIGVPKHRGRALRVLFVLFLIGTAGFVFAYYLPLYRAHATLRGEFQRLADEHAKARADLKLTLAGLERVTKERDTLQTAAHAEQTRMQAGGQRLEQLRLQIEPKLKADQKDKSIELVRDPKAMHLRLNAKRLFTPNGADLSAAGGKLVCTALAPLKVIPELTVVVEAEVAADAGWQAASTRASSAADWIASTCGVSPSAVRVVAPAASAASTSLLELSVQPR